MSGIIQTNKLSKNFGEVIAVENVSLNIKKGEIYGFLGLNGAGKTTTIRMLLGMISATSGTAKIFNEDIKRGGRGPWERVGCLVETPYSYPELTVRENLEIISRLRFLEDEKSKSDNIVNYVPDSDIDFESSPEFDKKRNHVSNPIANQETNQVTNIIKKLKLDSYENRKAGQLSLGNAQRLGLAKALMHNPEILILDEPANGLDPTGIVEIRKILLDLSQNHSVTIFISSHILAEISKIADRIGIIHKGKLVREVKSSELHRLIKKRLLVQTNDNHTAVRLLVKEGFNPKLVDNDHEIIILKDTESIEHPEKVTALLAANQLPPMKIFVDEEDLESYFLRVVEQAEKSGQPEQPRQRRNQEVRSDSY